MTHKFRSKFCPKRMVTRPKSEARDDVRVVSAKFHPKILMYFFYVRDLARNKGIDLTFDEWLNSTIDDFFEDIERYVTIPVHASRRSRSIGDIFGR